MAHYAQLDKNNIVIQVITGKDEADKDMELILRIETGKIWKRTSFNTRNGIHYDPVTGNPSEDQSKAFRVNYAGIGYSYNERLDAFILPKPFNSWVLNEETYSWDPPVAVPDEEKLYDWSEETSSWIERVGWTKNENGYWVQIE